MMKRLTLLRSGWPSLLLAALARCPRRSGLWPLEDLAPSAARPDPAAVAA